MNETCYSVETCCRSCKNQALQDILSLGRPPVADRLLAQDELTKPELLVPLNLCWCQQCSLLQIRETVSPEVLFSQDYPYYSSVSDSYLLHAQNYAEQLFGRMSLDDSSMVLEIACNDGYMLTNFQRRNIPVLGVDPAVGPVAAARKKNIEVINEFFTEELAERLTKENRFADVIIANNVLAHVPDPNKLIRGTSTLLKEDGLITVEVPWVGALLRSCAFDTIYHQHCCYFSLTALDSLFRRHKLFINDVEHHSVQGGSLRLFINPYEKATPAVAELLEIEDELGLKTRQVYSEFANTIGTLCSGLKVMLTELCSQGKSIAAYGAAAKANTLLHHSGIGRKELLWVADKNPVKQGLFMGGSHLPIVPVETVLAEQPDYLLLLSWNLADEILEQQKAYRERGGRFILPIPFPKVV